MLESIWLEKENIVSAGHVKTEQFQYYLQKGEGELICVAAWCL